ncbi:GH35 family beta-galactosidase [Dyella sp. Tek66A03]|uniref:GH35 family beta-galactosidase n=1 Tax=Dyella sp. Tek66A03 TaxID=3458298 RepID=UPI00403E550F
MLFALGLSCQSALAVEHAAAPAMPHLSLEHGAYQLIVDGAPFLIRGGELENSSASNRDYLEDLWPKLQAMRLNTVLAPVYWELIEPQEGRFDFSSIDHLVAGARQHRMKLVLLWFGSWKNSMSSYAPAWVKRDQQRFPRAARTDGSGLEILSALSQANLDADTRAFSALMQHLKDTDAHEHTVLMVQVENEVGMLPEARDHSATANAAFAAPVPARLTDYLAAHKSTLAPPLRDAWQAHGYKTGASWADTFGASPQTDELFNAWTEASFTGKVAASGKAVYPLPMFVNAALVRPGRLPGQYPSGGPLPHVFDVWKAAARALDFLAPDLYFPNFVEWANKYVQPDQAYFIPETGRASAADMAANAFYAFASLKAMGFSPYAPEFLSAEDAAALGDGYRVIEQLTPLLLASQGTGKLVGIRAPTAFAGTVDLSPQQVAFDPYRFDVHFKQLPGVSVGAKEKAELPGAHGGLIVRLGADEFIVAGTGMILTFASKDPANPIAGIESIQEGRYENGAWVAGRTINGDDSNQGRQLSLPSGKFGIFRVRLYRYR